ncbi:MAG: F0F1 ATP synthase subunit B [Bacillota bacterium]
MIKLNWNFFLQLLNFLVLMFLLKKFLYQPIIQLLDKREEKINNELDEAARRKKEAQEKKQKYEAQIQGARSEAQDIVQKAERRGKKRAREIIDEAREDAENIKQNKLEEIEQAQRDAARQLRDYAADLSIQAAGKLLQEQLDEEQQRELVTRYIEELDQEMLGDVQ